MKNHDLVICRCEEVTMEQIQEALTLGVLTAQEMKMATRAGMGICQGRMCRPLLEALMPGGHQEQSRIPSLLTYHKPIRPVRLSSIAKKEHSL